MNEKEKCKICGAWYVFSWTDIHGIGQCTTCGTPYRIYHYEGEKRLNKLPECLVKKVYVPWIQEYWETFQIRMPSNHSFPGGQELATPEEAEKFYQWIKAKREENL